MATKILGLDALEHIKDYVDGTSSNINYRIDTEIKNHIADKIAEATTNIQTDYDTQYNELINRISFVEQNGNTEELAELRLKLDALDANTQNKFNALDGISRELNKLTVDYQELYEGVTTGSVFSAGQLNEIINTAMIDSVDINPNAILTPEMYASKLVSLIGNFGQINAANIIGGDIKGHTISSNNVITGTEDPVWTIKDEGDGWLAKKNIQWDKNGNVTFGPGVKIAFDNVTGASDKISELMSGYDAQLQQYVEDYVKNNDQIGVTTEQLNEALEQAKSDVATALSATIDSKVETSAEQLTNTISKVETYLGAEYAVEGATLKTQLDAVTAAAEQAVADGNTELAGQLTQLQTELTAQLTQLSTSYTEISTAVETLKDDVQNLDSSAISQEGFNDLLEAALVDSTSVSADSLMTPNLIAQKIVSLVATFGTVNASKITGTHIQGYTISSPNVKKDEDGNIIYKEGEYELAYDENGNPIQAMNGDTPIVDAQGQPVYVYATDALGNKIPVPDTLSEEETAWILRADGTGHLANGNITWTKNGNLNVKGKITGSIGIKKTNAGGSDDENVYVDGNIVITNDGKPTTIIAGEYAYPTPNEDDIDGRTINISSGFPQSDIIYEWNNLDGVIDGVIPSSIYTLTNYTRGTLGIDVSDAYYKQNDTYYPIELNCYTDAYEVNSTLRLCLTIEFNNAFYRFAGPAEHTIHERNLNDFANTNIYSDGTIYTNSIVANNGKFNGVINSDGNFYGSLNNATGSILNAEIKDSNIVLSNNNGLVVKKSVDELCRYDDCNHLMTIDKDFKFLEELKRFVTENNIEPGESIKTLLSQFDDGYFQKGELYWHCSNTTPVIYEYNGKSYNTTANIKEILDSDEVGSKYYMVNPELKYNYDESTGIVYNDIFSIKPVMSLNKGGYSAFLPAITKEYTSEINSNYEHQVRYKLWSFDIFAIQGNRDGFRMPDVNTKAIIYQPNASYCESCNPSIKLYWKYDIDPMEDKYFHEFNYFNNTEDAVNLSKVEGDAAAINENTTVWSSKGPGETVFSEHQITKNGTISIYADFSVFLSKKHDINKANYKVTFSTGGIVTIIGNYTAPRNTMTIANDGLLIVTNSGHKIYTGNGDIQLLSNNGMHGLSISDNGVMIKTDSNEWQNLSDIIKNLQIN